MGLGDLICQFSYGGLGRLTRKLSPFPGYPNEYRTEHYYYDGVRRVQETWSDPISSFSPFSSEDEEAMQPATWVEREYVYGPGYVDEFVCQIDGSGRIGYILQDANYNVIAQADANGKVIEQLLWTPYGELLARESYLSFGLNKIGHQGLFFDRFDVPVTQAGLALPTSGAPPDGLYYNRNRSYSARLGRFVQRDPNGTGITVLSTLHHLGNMDLAVVGPLQLQEHLRDGLSVFAYTGSNPVNRVDETGLFFGYIGILASTTQSMDVYSNYNEEVVSSGAGAFGAVSSMINDYSFILEMALDWATDWDQPDDLLDDVGGGSAGWSLESGIAMAGGARGLRAAAGAARSVRGSRIGYHASQIAGRTLNRVFDKQGRSLKGKAPHDVPHIIRAAKREGWTVTKLGRGTKKGEGGLRMYKGDRAIYWNPGPSRHHPEFKGKSYWKISDGAFGVRRIRGR